MRFAFVIGVLGVLVGAASADPIRNDPAFLGIGMQDVQGMPGCQISSVVAGAAAANGGLATGDFVTALDDVAVTTCDQLSAQITRHASGDSVSVALAGGRTRVVQLTSRTEVMRKSLLGQTLAADLEVVERDAFVPLDLAAPKRGQITILGWFTPDCTSCDVVFGRVAQWSAQHRGSSAIGVTYLNPTVMATSNAKDFLSRYRHFDVPVALTNPPDPRGNFAVRAPVMFDPHRITFTIVDAHGEVTYVAPLALDGEDTTAALDELFVAASQAISPHGLHAISRR